MQLGADRARPTKKSSGKRNQKCQHPRSSSRSCTGADVDDVTFTRCRRREGGDRGDRHPAAAGLLQRAVLWQGCALCLFTFCDKGPRRKAHPTAPSASVAPPRSAPPRKRVPRRPGDAPTCKSTARTRLGTVHTALTRLGTVHTAQMVDGAEEAQKSLDSLSNVREPPPAGPLRRARAPRAARRAPPCMQPGGPLGGV